MKIINKHLKKYNKIINLNVPPTIFLAIAILATILPAYFVWSIQMNHLAIGINSIILDNNNFFTINNFLRLWGKGVLLNILLFGLMLLAIIFMTLLALLKKQKEILNERLKLFKANELLAKQEELFRTLFEQSPVGIVIGNSSGEFLQVNAQFENIMGLSQKELSEMTWHDITFKEDLPASNNCFDNFYTNKTEQYNLKKRYVKKDNSIVWVDLSVVPLQMLNDLEKKHIAILKDITNELKYEKDLQETEKNYAMMLANLPGMAYRCRHDKDWTMLFVSEGCYELTGYLAKDLIQGNNINYNDLITDEHKELVWDDWNTALENDLVYRGEYLIETANGKKKWVFEQGRGVYGEDGKLIFLEGLIIDINELKNREEEILYLNYHDILTGLPNRRTFEQEKKRLDRVSQLPLSIIVTDIDGLKLLNHALGHQEGDKVIIETAQILRTSIPPNAIVARTGGDEFSILLPKSSSEKTAKILKTIFSKCKEAQEDNEMGYPRLSAGYATKRQPEECLNKVLKAAEDSMFRYKLLQNQSLYSSILSSMKSSLFAKSQETEEHAERLIQLSKLIGEKVSLSDQQLNDLELLSVLHDIGKIGISDRILNKTEKLTHEEWIEIKKHPEIGYRIATSIQGLSQIASYILSHHERWDGEGYPQGLKGEEIPLLARILTIVDAYDAMTNDRSYRKAISSEEAIEEIKRNSGTQFDPKLVKIFIAEMGKNATNQI